jgi:hypothetical protein
MVRLYTWCGVVVLALAVSIAPIHAHTFKASTVEAQATITDGLAHVTFKVEIGNDWASPMTNVVVVFDDNTELNVGDIGGEATVTTERQNRTIDVSGSSSRTVVMHVTLKYSIDGKNIETPWILSVLAE